MLFLYDKSDDGISKMTLENRFLIELKNKQNTLNEGYYLYAIADGAINDNLVEDILGGFFDYTSIFTTNFENIYASKSPQLIKLDLEDEKTKQFLEKSFSKDWISFVFSNKEHEELAQTLKTYTIRPYKEKEIIIRWYDPRNIEEAFAFYTKKEIEKFFEDISGELVCIDNESLKDLKFYSFKENNLVIKTIDLELENGNK